MVVASGWDHWPERASNPAKAGVMGHKRCERFACRAASRRRARQQAADHESRLRS
jgi:hypothetical protein